MNYGMVQPTWDDCCGQPRVDKPSLFYGPTRLVCEKCGSWCNKPASLDPRPVVKRAPEWYERMWAS
jgi:hypothetical protein